jgi:dTDP-4-amino-4,6-dideoxygalactose transaminase
MLDRCWLSNNGAFVKEEVFSFHATKFINSFEGGAIATNDDALNEKLRLMKNFGFAGFDKVIYLGTNGKMSEVSAAMGLTSLESIDEFVAVNRRNYEAYRQG